MRLFFGGDYGMYGTLFKSFPPAVFISVNLFINLLIPFILVDYTVIGLFLTLDAILKLYNPEQYLTLNYFKILYKPMNNSNVAHWQISKVLLSLFLFKLTNYNARLFAFTITCFSHTHY
jgi:hypothetical protein